MQLLQEGSRTEDDDSLIAPDCLEVLEVLVTGDEIVCLSGERSCYHEVIFRMACHAMDWNSERNKLGCAPVEGSVQ